MKKQKYVKNNNTFYKKKNPIEIMLQSKRAVCVKINQKYLNEYLKKRQVYILSKFKRMFKKKIA